MLEHAISWITLGATNVRPGSNAEGYGQMESRRRLENSVMI